MPMYKQVQTHMTPKPLINAIWGFPKIRCTLLGVPIIRTIVFWGLYWGPLILGNYHMSLQLKAAAMSVS